MLSAGIENSLGGIRRNYYYDFAFVGDIQQVEAEHIGSGTDGGIYRDSFFGDLDITI